MSELTTGGPEELTWSYPSPAADGTTSGFVWMGYEEATESNQQEWVDFLNSTNESEHTIQNTGWDKASFVGLYNADWTSNFYSKTTGGDKPGGLGSRTYETQNVGTGVKFTKTPIWHYTVEGAYVKEIPADCGAYHSVDVGGGNMDNHAGPATDSDAAKYLGDSTYYWDDTCCWYGILSDRQ